MALTTGRTPRQLTFAVLAAGAASFSLMQSLVSPVLTTVQNELHTSQNTVTWVLTAYLLSASIFTPILGRIGDMVGKKRTMVVTLVVLAVGCLLAAVATDIGVLIVARVVQGVGGAVFPLSFGIIRDEFPPERVPSAVGSMSGIIAVGGGLGIVLAGPIVDAFGYAWLFWIPTIVVTAAAVAAHLAVPESPVRTPGRINWRSAVLLSAWLVALLLPLSKAPAWGWASTRVIGSLIVAAVLLAAWLAAETRAANPLVDMRMMRLPAVWTTNLVALLFGASMFAMYGFVPEFVQTPGTAGYGFGATITQAGLLMVPMLVTMFAASVLSGRIARVIGAKAQLAAGAAVSALACGALAAVHDERWQIALATALFGLGLGLAYSSMTIMIVQNVPSHQTGVASGMNTNIRNVGGAIGAAVMSSIVTADLQSSGLPREAGFTSGFAMLAGTCLAAVVAALLVPTARRGGKTTTTVTADVAAPVPVR